MARRFLVPIDLAKNELQNAVVQNLAAAPAGPLKGQLYFDSTGNVLYWFDGTKWVAASGGLDTVAGDARYVNITGDTMTGALDMSAQRITRLGDPVNIDDAVNRRTSEAYTEAYVDNELGTHLADPDPHTQYVHVAGDTMGGTLNMGRYPLINLPDPAGAADAVTKQYVDNLVAGLAWKEPVRLASTAPGVALSGLGIVDGVQTVAGDRILAKNHTFPEQCGIYLASAGAWTRTIDADSAADLEAAAVFIMEGATLADTAWVCTNNPPIVLGTTPITFVQFSGAGSFLVDHSVTNIKLAQVPQNTIKGRYSAGTGDVEDLNSTMLGDLLSNRFTEFAEFTLCDGVTNSTTVVHNFNKRGVHVEVYRSVTPWDTVECDIERPSLNEVTIRFASIPTAGAYQAVVIG